MSIESIGAGISKPVQAATQKVAAQVQTQVQAAAQKPAMKAVKQSYDVDVAKIATEAIKKNPKEWTFTDQIALVMSKMHGIK